MGLLVGAANNGVSNPSTSPSNTAKSPARATKNSSVPSQKLKRNDVSKRDVTVLITSDSWSAPDGTSAELEKLPNVVTGGQSNPMDRINHALMGGNPDHETIESLVAPMKALLGDTWKDGFGKLLLVGDDGQVLLSRLSRMLGLKSKNGIKLIGHKVNNNDEFLEERHPEINAEFVEAVLRMTCKESTINNFLSPGSANDADPELEGVDADLDVSDVSDVSDDEAGILTRRITNGDVGIRGLRFEPPTAHLLRKNSISESFDENSFNKDAGLTEPRNRTDSVSSRDSEISSDFYTRQSSEIGNTHKTNKRSNSSESGTSASNIPGTKFSEKTTVKQRMPAENENNIHAAESDGLKNIETKKSSQPDTIEEPALQEATSLDFSIFDSEGREDINLCLESFLPKQAADLKKINNAKLKLEKIQPDPGSASASDIDLVHKHFENRNNAQDQYQQFMVKDAENVKQLKMMQRNIAQSGAKTGSDVTLLRIGSLKNAIWSDRVQMAQHIDGLMPTEEIVEHVERLSAQRATSSPSATKPTAGLTIASPSFVTNIKEAEPQPDDSTHIFEGVFSPDRVVSTLGTTNGSESKTTPIPESPSGLPTGISPGNTQRIKGEMGLLEKDKRKAVKNTPPKGMAGIKS